MSKLFLYINTLKHLKPSQLYYRILKRFIHPKVRNIIAKPAIAGVWVTQELYQQKFLSRTDVDFLNHKGAVNSPDDWNNEKKEKLWLYNLHYFDDLNSFDSSSRTELQQHWINKWIDDNSAIKGGNGWESYTLSLRIVNWTKRFLSGLEPDCKMLDSLAQQADFLSQDLEKHLLGNHYFVNLKALLFAGCYLKGKEADTWLSIALTDYEKELLEQVLSDGGSFELTPMYHAIMLTDLLDLYNLFKTYPSRIPVNVVSLTKNKIIKMLAWLNIMSHGDNKISFFNDSAFEIAPDNSIIRQYAKKLGFDMIGLNSKEDSLVVYNLHNTGYVVVKSEELSLIADLSPVGPSYIPGHAHADSLSFELSLGLCRVFVNSGTSEYGMSDERLRQRGTSAHNTVEINNQNSSEVWSGFRVARRARIGNRIVGQVTPDKFVKFSAAHDGYQKQGIKCIHHRTWKVSLNRCDIEDYLQGDFNTATGYLHLHPDVKIVSAELNNCVLETVSHQITLRIIGANIKLRKSSWHPEFGMIVDSKVLVLGYNLSKVSYQISWKKI